MRRLAWILATVTLTTPAWGGIDEKHPAAPELSAAEEPAVATEEDPTSPKAAAEPVTPEPPPPPLGAEQRARQLYEQGARAYAEGRSSDAILFFKRAARVWPSPKLAYNIGLAYEDLGDAGNALTHYRALLRALPDVEGRADVVVRIERMERHLLRAGVQQLRVYSEPSGAVVIVDGEPRGTTPFAETLTPGVHQLMVRLEGHAPQERAVRIEPESSRELELTLASEPAEPEGGPVRRLTPLTWSLLGVGSAAVLGGVFFEMSRADSAERSRSAESSEARAKASGEVDAKQSASLTLLGFGTGLLIAGGVLMGRDLGWMASGDGATTSSATARLLTECGPLFCGVTASGRF